jgi:hypothetical protein
MRVESLRELDLLPFEVEDGSEFDTGELVSEFDSGEVVMDEGGSKPAVVPVPPLTAEFQY